MKSLIFLVCIFYASLCFSQNDVLIIRLQSGLNDTIKLNEISSIKFIFPSSVNEKTNPSRNYPNPFTDYTIIEFEMDNAGFADITIFDYNGNIVRNFKGITINSGKNVIKWDSKNQDGSSVPSGVYYYEIRFKGSVYLKQMIKVK